MNPTPAEQFSVHDGSAAEVFGAFLKLGLTSFGGPIAHLGYFRDELVTRRRWLDDDAYADLVALCQFLPGPASSQLGFALGLMRAGWRGALAAFTAFTLPSALLLLGFALVARRIDSAIWDGLLSGLKIVAVAIVAQAVWGMSRSLCPDRPRAAIAIGAVVALAALPGAAGMIGAIGIGALAGLALPLAGDSPRGLHLRLPVRRAQAVIAAALFLGLLGLLPLLTGAGQAFALLDGFYRAGALVFGGGHVVLPLLQAETVATGWVSPDSFLAGYGAAQAVPGPLFTFAAYLGAVLEPKPNGLAGAALALAALFLPGFLLLIAALPLWDRLRRMRPARAAMSGANAAVVGILGAALYDPVFTGAIHSRADFALALICAAFLMIWRAPPWSVVLLAALGGAGLRLAV
ncbi:chromate efflux transporter [Paracoccus sediminicola]|uniref:chromate efflux transporter n=1 Tax=Paracoccus sediminicola TaxID=3017783 RepID=UPI0022F0D533|nr:chromate efflux transporter [Paracoccus sediminicola]WBU55463.1 chromate efflux transporter [Paracoccus sediminicola]